MTLALARPRPAIPADSRALAADPAHVAAALRIARRRARPVPYLRDDLEGAALLGLALAARDFDPARGHDFLAYATPRILGAILDEMRASGWFARTPRGVAAPPPGPLDRPALAGDLPVGWEEESRDAVERLSRRLPPAHGAAVRLRYLDCGASKVREVGGRLGVGLARASQLLDEAHAMLRGPDAVPSPRRPWHLAPAERAALERLVRDDPAASHAAIAARFRRETGRPVSTTTRKLARRRLGIMGVADA